MTSPADAAPAPLLRVVGLSKQFPGVRALDEVDLDLTPGEVHALVGENGAGKSTLIKILSGLFQPSAGTITLDGRPREFGGPVQSRGAGISVIAQEFNLVPQLTVAENIFLGQEPRTRLGLVDKTTMDERSRALLATLGLGASPRQRVEHLAVADQQLVEIAKALSQEFRVLVMDEPTAALNAAEVDRLLAIVDGLRKEGRSVLYVSHRLGEIFRIADRVTVLRDGRRVTTVPIAATTEPAVVAWMLGRTVEEAEIVRAAPAADRPSAVTVGGLTIPGVLDDVSFELRYGEVLGVAGLVGSGRSELSRVMA
ncbi:MAG TPA: sugar ABC transporter ATP-binding protein, partial [Thermomicrobiales bacterium]|nr:sugar ABC transporter ATP-binding protein [Thermomicrobiales bacterium]